MKRIFISTQTGSDWQRLLAKPQLHWKNGRSAMTAAASWEYASSALPPEIAILLNSSLDDDLSELKLLAAIPEWEVSLEGGDTASHTDVLALAQNSRGLCVIAVEAKVDEDFGPLKTNELEHPTDNKNGSTISHRCSASRRWTMGSGISCFIALPRQF